MKLTNLEPASDYKVQEWLDESELKLNPQCNSFVKIPVFDGNGKDESSYEKEHDGILATSAMRLLPLLLGIRRYKV